MSVLHKSVIVLKKHSKNIAHLIFGTFTSFKFTIFSELQKLK